MVFLRRPLLLALALAAVGAAGCGGSDDSASPQGATPGAGSPTRECENAPPSRVADGVNDDQGGSRPGTDPCAGE
ncbi:MAG TPA: hypothetical protein VNB64_05630 [Solirubrobacteraceae bacterium]|nr:hypothetical protein [Solirubrobacteraceae bacterium]